MKLNWGHKLVFFALLFMGFVVYMVYRISTQKVDLVDQNYYERGVKYQEEINKYKAAATVAPQIRFSLIDQKLVLSVNQPVAGLLTFYRVADAGSDFSVPFVTDSSNQFDYGTNQLQKGNWKATFEWTLNDTLMAVEKQIMIE
ncbi:MAG: FixH family protein [Bacteroidia bacterium]|jgi:hypothetical protein|nr:FixH family protein [Bacteroidia bacterium]